VRTCSQCGSAILTGQLVCPGCGRPQRKPRQVRCRYCGAAGSRELVLCPACGERLQSSWLRPILYGAAIIAAVLMGLVAAQGLHRTWDDIRPMVAVSTMQAFASEVPGLFVVVPTVTPSLTPSPTVPPTRTPTATPTPSLTPTPTPTETPSPTPTPEPTSTPTPSPTRLRVTRAPTLPAPTRTPAPTLPAPVPLTPEDGVTYRENAQIMISWRSDYATAGDDFFELILRFTHNGQEVRLPSYLQVPYWYVSKDLYLEADQETGRLYEWSVRVVRKTTDSGGKVVYIPLSASSVEKAFYWK
jgi:RNA polymerase subunit RPABC4/transcription elongation factor Spt4